jgi:chromosome segregation ATPase
MNKIKVVTLFLLGFTLSFPAAARLYKWVDEKGVTHYGEVVPPEYANRSRSELTAGGRLVNKNEALTPEQLKAKEEATKKQRSDDEALLDQKRRDKALLNTFSSVDEIEAAKIRNLQQLESMIASTTEQIKITQKTLADLKREANSATAAGKHIPIGVRDELKDVQARLTKQQTDLEQYKAEKQVIENRFEADKARYRYLRSGGQ